MKILLAYRNHKSLAEDYYSSILPVGLLTISAFLKNRGFDTRVVNFSRMSNAEIQQVFMQFSPRIVGISQFTHNRAESIELAAQAKALLPGVVVVMGGPHATFSAEEMLLQLMPVDIVVRGEGEAAMLEIAERVIAGEDPCSDLVRGIAFRREGNVCWTKQQEPIADLDAIPLPYQGIENSIGVDIPRQLEFIITSRGCPSSCHFCSSPAFWGRSLRFRSPDSIVKELRYLRDRYGLLYFSIRDDTFTADRKRVIELCKKMLEAELYFLWNCQSRVTSVDEEVLVWMKRAGCECIQFGVESGSEKVLTFLGKQIAKRDVVDACRLVKLVGLNLSIYLITGVPGETMADLDETLALIDEIKPHDGQVSPLAYYPGTQLFTAARHDGLLSQAACSCSKSPGIYVRQDSFTRRAMDKILGKLQEATQRNAYTRDDFVDHAQRIGFSHATNLMAGAMYAREGDFAEAEQCYREICHLQPRNPWGWSALGELYLDMGNLAAARRALTIVTELVPSHASSHMLLGQLALQDGKMEEGRRFLRKAAELDKWDKDIAALLKTLERNVVKGQKKRAKR